MARPREFDEGTVLEAAGLCFWKQGYEATSVRDLVARTGITLRACVRSGLCSRVSPRWHFSALSLERTGRDRKDRISEALQDEMTDGFLRSRYEAAVVALCTQVAAMRGDGASPETIARAVHVERRRLTGAFKALTPEPWRSRIRTWTLAAYGDLRCGRVARSRRRPVRLCGHDPLWRWPVRPGLGAHRRQCCRLAEPADLVEACRGACLVHAVRCGRVRPDAADGGFLAVPPPDLSWRERCHARFCIVRPGHDDLSAAIPAECFRPGSSGSRVRDVALCAAAVLLSPDRGHPGHARIRPGAADARPGDRCAWQYRDRRVDRGA